jgi:hypothetical protein
LVIAPAVVASSCTPTAPLATTPAPAGAAHTWGASTTYTNDAVGFTIQYPAAWKMEKPGAATAVLQLAKDPSVAADRVYVYVIPAATDLAAAAKGLLDNSAAFQQYKVLAKIDSSQPFTLASGSVTNATVTELSSKIVNFLFYFYTIGATKGDKSVNVMGSTIVEGNARKVLREICQTLSFK